MQTQKKNKNEKNFQRRPTICTNSWPRHVFMRRIGYGVSMSIFGYSMTPKLLKMQKNCVFWPFFVAVTFELGRQAPKKGRWYTFQSRVSILILQKPGMRKRLKKNRFRFRFRFHPHRFRFRFQFKNSTASASASSKKKFTASASASIQVLLHRFRFRFRFCFQIKAKKRKRVKEYINIYSF